MTKDAITRKNTILGLFAIVIWSFAALLAVELTSIPAFELLFMEFLVAFFTVVARYSISENKAAFFNFQKKDLLITAAIIVVNQVFYYSAFRYAPAAEVDLINYLWPTLLILFSSLLPSEKICPSYLLACALCIFGLYTLLSPDDGQTFSNENIMGYFFALGAAISWALYSLYTRYGSSSSSVNCISWACGPAALACLFVHLTFETFVVPNLFESLLILLLGIFQIGLAFYFWENGLKKGSVKFLGLSSYSIPVFSVLLLVLFGKTDFEPRMVSATITISLSPLIPLAAEKVKELKIWVAGQSSKQPELASLKRI